MVDSGRIKDELYGDFWKTEGKIGKVEERRAMKRPWVLRHFFKTCLEDDMVMSVMSGRRWDERESEMGEVAYSSRSSVLGEGVNGRREGRWEGNRREGLGRRHADCWSFSGMTMGGNEKDSTGWDQRTIGAVGDGEREEGAVLDDEREERECEARG
ncbi:hypothetical protein BDQ17DRAFT_1322681 [Cyathus striatus]|nr:hypothetical protein BDQ17DRAFT_1322681 [Cyathus striatus]